MGLSSRDYYRDTAPSPWTFGGAEVVKYLIIANVVVFILQVVVIRKPAVDIRDLADHIGEDGRRLTPQQVRDLVRSTQPVSVVQEWFELDTDKVVNGGQVWRLLTHAFCHDRYGLFHILFNMLALFWFGRALESMYGPREFLLFYLTGAVVAGLAYIALDLVTGERAPAIGASGAVMAVMMLYTMHFPGDTIYIFWFIPLEMRWVMALYVIYDVHPVLLALAGDRVFTGVAHAAHLGGLAFGFCYSWYNWRLEPLLDRLPGRPRVVRRRPRLRLARPPEEVEGPGPDADRLDAVLEKIARSGTESLTDEEREILVASSRQLKARRGRPD